MPRQYYNGHQNIFTSQNSTILLPQTVLLLPVTSTQMHRNKFGLVAVYTSWYNKGTPIKYLIRPTTELETKNELDQADHAF
jgi:hypothetical protein